MPAFPQVKFLTSAHQAHQFPPDTGVEVAVAGRSNAGKSSAINAITQRKGLAKTSKTPGATRLINFFEIDAGRRLVDLPGYGFAAVPGPMRHHWATLVESYFRIRESLRGAIVVMDVRHPLTEHDQTMLALAQAQSVPVHIVLTKADKLGGGAARQKLAQVRKAVGDGATAQLFSSLSGEGVGEARGVVLRLLAAKPQKETPVGPADPTGAS
ncbi:MAG: GTP-binding protein [Pseudomonadota bacterium]|jgi:GTP-binding protein|nr:GTP-binding protein [Pseudomonadota bacterium]